MVNDKKCAEKNFNKANAKGSPENNSIKPTKSNKLAEEVKALQIKYQVLIGLVSGAILLIVFELLGISYDIAKNYELNERVNQLEKENISRNLIFIENTKMQSGVKDDLKNLENVNNIIFCLSSKKYWQYQECFNNKK